MMIIQRYPELKMISRADPEKIVDDDHDDHDAMMGDHRRE